MDTTLTTDTRIHTAPTQLLEDNTRIRSCDNPLLFLHDPSACFCLRDYAGRNARSIGAQRPMIDAPQATRPSRLLDVARPFLSPPTLAFEDARSRGPHRRQERTGPHNRSSGSIMLRFVQPPRAPGVTLPLQAHQMTKIDRACREVRLSFLEVPHSNLTKAEDRGPHCQLERSSGRGPQAVSELTDGLSYGATPQK